MNPEDLDAYNIQLEQVNLAISKDPENAELLNLKADLTKLIDLTKDVLEIQQSTTKKPTETKVQAQVLSFEIGDHCLARWEDGGYYEAVVSAKTDVEGDILYSVIFVGYNNVEIYKLEDLKAFVPQNKPPEPSEMDDKDKKKKKKKRPMPKAEGPTKGEADQKKKQDAWLKFANKKAKVKVGSVSTKSIFSTPDNPHSKVGVVGSGKPMTQFAQRGKHVFTKK